MALLHWCLQGLPGRAQSDNATAVAYIKEGQEIARKYSGRSRINRVLGRTSPDVVLLASRFDNVLEKIVSCIGDLLAIAVNELVTPWLSVILVFVLCLPSTSTLPSPVI